MIVCDTIVATSEVTLDGSVLFGKNSDRQPNEPQSLLHLPAKDNSEEKVKCTYIKIDQVDHSHEVLLSKPIWIWGAEMGTNEFGVTIGNEAIFSNIGDLKEEKLIGMDLVRLGLERGETATDAMVIITELLEKYGQGGNCGFTKPEFYDNSFIIADTKEAWVLETAGRYWVAKQVKGIRTISNVMTITNDYDKIHPDFINYAVEEGKCKSEDDFNFREQFKARFMHWAARGDARRACTTDILDKKSGKITPITMMNALRSHNSGNEDEINPRSTSMSSPCLHASSFITPSQTTASLVSHLKSDLQLHWATATSSPCISVFKPLILQQGVYEFEQPKRKFDQTSLWWQYEKLHRLTLKNFNEYEKVYADERQSLEQEYLDQIYDETYNVKLLSPEEIYQYSKTKLDQFQGKVQEWYASLLEYNKQNPPGFSLMQFRYNRYWKKKNTKAEMPKLKK